MTKMMKPTTAAAVALATTVLILAPAPVARAAVVLSNAVATYSLNTSDKHQSGTAFGGLIRHVDSTRVGPTGEFTQEVASVNIGFTINPIMIVEAHVDVAPGTTCATCGPAGTANASADLRYQMAVTPSHIPVPPLNGFSLIPIWVTQKAGITITGPVRGWGDAWVTGPGTLGVASRTIIPSSLPSVTRTSTFSAVPNTPYDVWLHANMGAYADVSAAIFSQGGEAWADPTFAFNQPAFDAIQSDWGLPSFPLADYFTFQYSPNLALAGPGPGIPEPATLALLAVGLAGLGLIRRRRRRA